MISRLRAYEIDNEIADRYVNKISSDYCNYFEMQRLVRSFLNDCINYTMKRLSIFQNLYIYWWNYVTRISEDN